MRVKFFVVPALDPASAETEVNAFLGQHRIAVDAAAKAHRRSISQELAR